MTSAEIRHNTGTELAGDPNISVVRDIPISNLFEKDGMTMNTPDSASIYSICQPLGTEYAIVFPPVNGQELYRRLQEMAHLFPGIYDVAQDIKLGIDDNAGYKKPHEQGLGDFWNVVYPSLDFQQRLFADSIPQSTAYQEIKLKRAKANLATLKEVSELTPVRWTEVDELREGVLGMINGEAEPDIRLLIDAFDLSVGEISRARNRQQETDRAFSRQSIGRQLKNTSYSKMLAPLVLEAARRRVRKDDANDQSNQFDDDSLQMYAFKQVRKEIGGFVLRNESGTYILPKPNGRVHLSRKGKAYELVFNNNLSDYFNVAVAINDEGQIVLVDENKADELTKEIDELQGIITRLNGKKFHEVLAVPIVRVRESKGGTMGLVFEDSGTLSDLVRKDIEKGVTQLDITPIPFQTEWVSDVVGMQTLVALHPEIKEVGEEWDEIWSKERITMSEFIGEKPREDERTQMNGPLQAGMIALQAAYRHPEVFLPFMEKVRSTVKKDGALLWHSSL